MQIWGKRVCSALLICAVIATFLGLSVPVEARQGGPRGGRPGRNGANAPEATEEQNEEAAETETEFEGGILAADADPEPTEQVEDTETAESTGQKAVLPHGTAEELITEDMLDNTPPADYEVNPDMQAEAKEGRYNAYFLKDALQTVSIEIDENNLNYLLQNAADKPSVMTKSVTIGDQTIGYTGLKTKGSYTLQHSVTENKGSDRFSFTVNFGKYIKKKDYGVKQNFYGVRKISFNNFFFDKSMMKEYCALTLLSDMGLPAPQFGLAKLYINGDYYGVYCMIEAMDHSILEQYYDVDKDELSSYLTKPEGTSFYYDLIAEDDSPLWEYDEETKEEVSDMLPTVVGWVKKLNQLAEGKDFEDREIDVNSDAYLALLEQIMDVDESVKYFACHSWLCQMDNMFVGQKNFGLYVDENGRSLIVPWDYDLSFGCYFPSDAESTANYDIDVMYRQQWGWGGNVRDDKDSTYSGFPLFYVIYQNDSLMERYHQYMKDCSRVMALGGTIYSGESFEPGRLAAAIDVLKDPLYEAASDALADNVYYMNGANQPRDVKTALTNLSKIIAMRSVGVLLQVDGENTQVSAKGCNLSTLGNAIEGWYQNTGSLAAVDDHTGIFVTASYPAGSDAPALTVEKLTPEDEMYQRILAKLSWSGEDSVVIRTLKNSGTPTGESMIRIPLSKAYLSAEGEITVYTFADDGLTAMDTSLEDNLLTGTYKNAKYLVIRQAGGNEEGNLPAKRSIRRRSPLLPVAGGCAAAVLLAAVMAFVLGKRRKRIGKAAAVPEDRGIRAEEAAAVPEEERIQTGNESEWESEDP